MTDQELQDRFHADPNLLFHAAPKSIGAAVADKFRLHAGCADTRHPRQDALNFRMEKLHTRLSEGRQHGKTVRAFFGSLVGMEDRDPELEFRRIAASNCRSGHGRQDFRLFGFDSVCVTKSANAVGLQPAGMTAGPIALPRLRPNQPNRAFEIIGPKLGRLGPLP